MAYIREHVRGQLQEMLNEINRHLPPENRITLSDLINWILYCSSDAGEDNGGERWDWIQDAVEGNGGRYTPPSPLKAKPVPAPPMKKFRVLKPANCSSRDLI